MGAEALRVCVIGAGKMGLPLAAVMASRGASVVAVDVNEALVASINAGIAPFDEPGLSGLVESGTAAGRLTATSDAQRAIADSEVVITIVPVMLAGARADLSTVESIAESLAAALRRGSLVVFETTLPVGTTRMLGQLIERGGLRAGTDFDLVFSPERVKSRFVIRNLTAVPKIVGGITTAATDRAEAFYRRYLGSPVIRLESLEAAELAKLVGMIYRDVNIALANELAEYATVLGIDFEAVRDAANTDGEAALLSPGIGVGGHCTPVYPHFALSDAAERGLSLDLTRTARSRNASQPERVLSRIPLNAGDRALILGVAFRPGVKEAALSPAFGLRDALLKRGVSVEAYDPLYTAGELEKLGFTPGSPAGQEIAILVTAHPQFTALDLKQLASCGTRVLVDGRGLFDPVEVRAAGITYVGVSRTARSPAAAPAGE